jgi:hypothetical protein
MRPLVVACVALSFAACGGGPEQVSQEDIDSAGQALAPLKKQLMGALTKGLEQGPDSAIVVCKIEAHEIAASLSGSDIQVGRTSHKLRNPDNAPEPWMATLLDAYVSGTETGAYRAVGLPNGDIGYVEPIYIKPMCLTCHGEVTGSLAVKLDALYPADRATGFKDGDFRGLFWVKKRPAPTG